MPPMHHADRTAAPSIERPTVSPSRRALLKSAAAFAPMIAVGAGAATSASAFGGYHNTAGLTMIDGSEWPHPEIRSVDFRFDTGGTVKTFPPSLRVTVPPGYHENPDRRYPVLLLLHGRSGNFLEWSDNGNIIEESAKHDVIVVMPDGGAGSFYSNANRPILGREAAWETYIMEQVLPFVHSNFRTRPDSMAIAGLSMGGWGALSLGQRYWGHFRSVSSYSGPADCSMATPHSQMVFLAIWICGAAELLGPFAGMANPPGAAWGDLPDTPLVRSYNPMDNIEKYRGKRIFMRTGDGPLHDLLEGFDANADLWQQLNQKANELFGGVIEQVVHPTQQRFSDALNAAGIQNDYKLIPGATHEWGLWKDNLAEDLPGMMKVLNA